MSAKQSNNLNDYQHMQSGVSHMQSGYQQMQAGRIDVATADLGLLKRAVETLGHLDNAEKAFADVRAKLFGETACEAVNPSQPTGSDLESMVVEACRRCASLKDQLNGLSGKL